MSLPLLYFFERYAAHRALHSFPTRRSSDLELDVGDVLDRLRHRLGIDPERGERRAEARKAGVDRLRDRAARVDRDRVDRKSTRLNSSHGYISYAVFCLKKKNITISRTSGIT